MGKTPTEEVEAIFFGPGFGESIAIHVGGGNWIIVDSCLQRDPTTNSSEPAPLAFLKSRGVDVASQVKLIICSHWHDDHVRGMHQIVAECTQARFLCAAAVSEKAFLKFMGLYTTRNTMRSSTGLDELRGVLETIDKRQGKIEFALGTTRHKTFTAAELGSNYPVEIWTLSPSSQEFREFLESIKEHVLPRGATKQRCPAIEPNHVAVVSWIQIGATAILLGSDLEETGNKETGWSAILAAQGRPTTPLADVYKVAHHGSITGHLQEKWIDLLATVRIAVLTPFNKGVALPKTTDVERILNLTDRAYSTSNYRPQAAPKFSKVVQKTIDDYEIKVRSSQPKFGAVRLSKAVKDSNWAVQLVGAACELQNVWPNNSN